MNHRRIEIRAQHGIDIPRVSRYILCVCATEAPEVSAERQRRIGRQPRPRDDPPAALGAGWTRDPRCGERFGKLFRSRSDLVMIVTRKLFHRNTSNWERG